MRNTKRIRRARELRDREWFRLSPDERAAWLGFLRAHAEIVKELDGELESESGLPLSSFDALLQLSISPEERLRMHELADAVLLSRSGLTRLVDRLERDGLVERRRSAIDPRQTYAEITERGYAALARAIPPHLEGIRARFLDRLSDEQLAQLAEIWRTLLAGERAEADDASRQQR